MWSDEKRRTWWAEWRKANPEKFNAHQRKWLKKPGNRAMKSARARKNHPEMVHAWDAVYRAIKFGRVIRPQACAKCNRPCRPQAHHWDYRKPLEIEWLCRECHLAIDGYKLRVRIKGDA